jgi:hypothetical protein
MRSPKGRGVFKGSNTVKNQREQMQRRGPCVPAFVLRTMAEQVNPCCRSTKGR